MYEKNRLMEAEETELNSKASPKQPAAGQTGRTFQKNRSVDAHLDAGMLENNRMSKPRSVWDVLVSFSVHAAIVVALILIPLVYTNALDLPQYQRVFLAAPPPPPPPPAISRAPRVPKESFFTKGKLYAPKEIPKQIAQVKEPEAGQLAGVPEGVPGGVPGGQLGGVIGGVLSGVRSPLAPPPKPALPTGPIRVGGVVRPPRLVRKVQPMYPPLARQTRTQGDVVIDCVIDPEGNVTQMRVVSGHPLLVQAAMDAVRGWKYQPTLLNGTPVSVEMTVTLHFNLANE